MEGQARTGGSERAQTSQTFAGSGSGRTRFSVVSPRASRVCHGRALRAVRRVRDAGARARRDRASNAPQQRVSRTLGRQLPARDAGAGRVRLLAQRRRAPTQGERLPAALPGAVAAVDHLAPSKYRGGGIGRHRGF